MIKKGDLVQLNALGKSAQGLGNKEYIPNPCSERLLRGEAAEVSDVVPCFAGSRFHSLLFDANAYSFSVDYFEKV